MIKICFVTTISLTLKTFVLDFAKYLQESNEFEVTMICSSDEAFATLLPERIRFIPVDMKRGFGLDGFKVIRRLTKIFKANHFDIVQYSTPNASCYASIAAKRAKVPVRLYCQWGIAYTGFYGLKRFILKRIEKQICKNSTWIEPDSNGNLLFSHKEKLYPLNKGSVVWNGSASGVSPEKFNINKKNKWRSEIRDMLAIDGTSFVYGFVGRITKDKGINELFKAFKEILYKKPSSYLICVGNIEKKETINDVLLSWAQSESRILFIGYSNSVEKYLSAMDCYILPSYREGFGLGVVEAEAMGTPVIVTNIPGPTDAMIDGVTGIVVQPRNSIELEKAMLKLQNDKETLSCYSKNAAQFAMEKFDRKTLFSKMIADRKSLAENASND